MMVTVRLLLLTLLITTVCGEGLEDRKGPLGHKVLDVPEGTPVPYAIYQFRSAVPGVSSYRVSGEDDRKISISADGWLYLEQPLDWAVEKRHTLDIEALSDGETVDGPYTVTLFVLDINNNIPVFSLTQYIGSVREHTPPGVPIVRVFASDADDPETPNAHLSFSIDSQLPPTHTPFFSIDPVTGDISTTAEGAAGLKAREGLVYGRGEQRGSSDVLKRKFDEFCSPVNSIPYETNPFFTCVQRAESRRLNPLEDPDYFLTVRVEDLGGGASNALSSTARVAIAVTQNFWVNPGPISIKENLEVEYPRQIAKVRANDPDAVYRLVQKERQLHFPFTISADGEISVTERLDREEKAMYLLVVLAEDEQGVLVDPAMEFSVTVLDENDNAPECEEELSVFEVQENEIVGNQVGILLVHDADDEATPNALLSYTILSQSPPTPSDAMFSLDATSGRIQVAKQNFQRKVTPEYHLNIRVSDGLNASAHSTECKVVIKVIDINNEIPVFEKNDYGKHNVSEDTPVGTTVLTLKATDADDPGTGSSRVEYHITAGDPHGDFTIAIDDATGEGHLITTKILDYEEQVSYELQIDARNPEPLVKGVEYDARATATVVIELVNIDEPPVFDMDVLDVNVPENLTVGTTILKIEAKDPEGQDIKFKLEGDDHGWLQMDADSGELKTKAKLDREEVDHLNVRVIVYEKANPEQRAEREVSVRLLDVNDNVPRLRESQAFICVKNLQPVLLTAEDQDSDPYGAPFTFTLSKGRKSPNWELKAVDGTSAKLSLKKTPPSDETFSIPINIKDNAGMGITHKFEVRVCNCTELGYCYIEPGSHNWKYNAGATVGILGGTFGVILLILLIVMYRIKKGNQKAPAEGETEAMM